MRDAVMSLRPASDGGLATYAGILLLRKHPAGRSWPSRICTCGTLVLLD